MFMYSHDSVFIHRIKKAKSGQKNVLQQSEMLLGWVSKACTCASGQWHLYRWHSVTWISAPMNWPLDLKAAKFAKFLILGNGTCTSATERHSAKWSPTLYSFYSLSAWSLFVPSNIELNWTLYLILRNWTSELNMVITRWWRTLFNESMKNENAWAFT